MPGLVGGFGIHNNLSLAALPYGRLEIYPTYVEPSEGSSSAAAAAAAAAAVMEATKKLTFKNTAAPAVRMGTPLSLRRGDLIGDKSFLKSKIGPYLAGLIEGDGTFAVHNTKSTIKKYSPVIIIVFKKADLPLANYLRDLTNCGRVFIKQDRGYVLWQIQDLVSVFTIITIINGFMRTPKIEAMHRTID